MSEFRGAARSAFLIIMITLVSKVLGFTREMVIAAGFGASFSTDAYVVALTIPAVLFSSFSRAIQTAFIPVFNELLLKEGKERVFVFSSSVLNAVALSLSLTSMLAYFFMPQITSVMAPGFEGEAYCLTISLARIMLPVGMVWGIIGISNGILNSMKIFTVPAAVGIAYNFVIISSVLTLGRWWGIKGLALGTALGVVGQFLIQVPWLIKLGLRWRLRLELYHPSIQKLGVLMLPVLASSVVVQLNVVVDRLLASRLPEGSISALNFANRLNGVVLGVFVFAFVTVIFPALSKKAASGAFDQFKKILDQGLKIIVFLTAPATVIILTLKVPLIRVLFQRGAFDNHDTLMTATAFLFYGLGLVAFGLREIINVAFFALQDTRTPMIIGISCLALNMVLNIILVGPMAHGGLAFATSLSCTVYVIAMLILLHRKLGIENLRGLFIFLGKVTASSVVMGLMMTLGKDVVPWGNALGIGQLFYLGGVGIIGAASFLGVFALLMSRGRSY